MGLKWAKEKQSWCVDDWMKVIFSGECIGQGNDAEDECRKKTSWLHNSFMICSCMLFKGPREMAVIYINNPVNACVYIGK